MGQFQLKNIKERAFIECCELKIKQVSVTLSQCQGHDTTNQSFCVNLYMALV